MEEITKMHVDWKKITVVGALVLLTGLTVGGLTWYVADNGFQNELEAYKNEIATLQTEVAQLKAEEAPADKNETVKTDTSTKTYTNSNFGFSFKYDNSFIETECMGTLGLESVPLYVSINDKVFNCKAPSTPLIAVELIKGGGVPQPDETVASFVRKESINIGGQQATKYYLRDQVTLDNYTQVVGVMHEGYAINFTLNEVTNKVSNDDLINKFDAILTSVTLF